MNDLSQRVVLEQLGPIRFALEDPGVTEIALNSPGLCHSFAAGQWSARQIPALTFDWALNTALTIASTTEQRIDRQSPLLSATLPTGHRAQIVIPPAVPSGFFSYTIRRPSDQDFSLEQLEAAGVFAATRIHGPSATADHVDLLRAGRFAEFFRAVVLARKNIVVSGSTGSGKTTVMKTLIRTIAPTERLIAIQNVEELFLQRSHPNAVSLMYSAGAQGVAQITPRQLMESALRMMPDRILVAELIRPDEAQFFLRNVNSGHPGSITSLHANTTELAIEQLAAFLRETSGGAGLTRLDMLNMISSCVDIVLQCAKVAGKYQVTEIRYVR